jgi:hypothetical protein
MKAPLIVAELRKNTRERLRVALDEWQGNHLLDLRITTQLAETTPDVWSPTKKGVSDNVAMIPALREALADAEAKAREAGLIDG